MVRLLFSSIFVGFSFFGELITSYWLYDNDDDNNDDDDKKKIDDSFEETHIKNYPENKSPLIIVCDSLTSYVH